MKKRKIKRKLNPIKIIRFIIIITLILVFSITYKNKLNKPTNTPPKDTILEQIKEKDKHYKLSVIAVGDNLIHTSLYKDANRLADGKGYNFKPMIENIKQVVKNYDIGYYNQETILGGTELGLSGYPAFNSPYEAGDAMIDAGFNLVSLATNHTVDSGINAVNNSCKYWNSHENVLTAGSYCSNEERNETKIMTKNNISYSMLNYTYGTNGIKVSEDYLVNVWPTENKEQYEAYKEVVKEDVMKLRDKVDVLIVAMHWGIEYTHNPTDYEIDMANFLANLDVDIVIGTHPHVIQPVTWINDTLVIYSLGNFISAQYQNADTCTYYKCTTGLMTNFNIEKTITKDSTDIKITNVENELIYNYYDQDNWNKFRVIPFSNPEIATYLKNYKEVYNTYKEVVQRLDNNMIVKDLYE